MANSLKYKTIRTNAKGQKCRIEIRLSDDCKNGYNDFSITGTIYEANKPMVEKYFISSGAIGKEIAKEFPEYAIFDKLHNCDYSGSPMYALGNGFYHLKGETNNSKLNKADFIEYFNISESQFNELNNSVDEAHFKVICYNSGIVEGWKKLADEGIKQLEKLTNETFTDNSVKSNIEPLTSEEIAQHKERSKNGFYTKEATEKRVFHATEEKKEKLLNDLKETFDKKHLEAIQDYEIDRIGIQLFLTTSNIIFYKHLNKIVFNWQDGNYNKKYTESEFKIFIDVAKENEYLKNCEFELK